MKTVTKSNKAVRKAGGKQKALTVKSPLIKTIIAAIQDKKGEQIVSLDLAKVEESIADFFIICEGSNPLQVKAIVDFIEEKALENCGEKPLRIDGKKGNQWIVMDYGDVIIHCMMPEIRKQYQLAELWHDANKLEH